MNELALLEQAYLDYEKLAIIGEDDKERYFNELAFYIENSISMLPDEVALKLSSLYDSYMSRYVEGDLNKVLWLLESLKVIVNKEILRAQEREYYTDDSMVRQLINMTEVRR